MLQILKNGQTSVIIRVKLRSSLTGFGLTGLTEASSGLIIGTIANTESATTRYRASSSEIETITTLGTFSAPTSGKVRFKEVDATNHPGVYEIQIADARWAVSNAKTLLVSISGASNLIDVDALVPLWSVDPFDTVRFGQTALPNAAAEAAGGLYTRGSGAGQINQPANGMIDANVVRNAGTAITAAAGVQEVKVASVAADAINASAVADGAIDAGAIASNAITSSKIADGTLTAAKFASGAFDAVWAVAARLLTAGTNIVLAKGTGVTGFNDLSAAQVNTEADAALADVGVTGVVTGRIDAAISTRAVAGDAMALTSGERASVGTAVWASTTRSLTSFGTLVADIITAIGSAFGVGSYLRNTEPLDAAGTRSAIGLASANLDTQLASIQADTDNLQTRIPAALTSDGLMKSDALRVAGTLQTAGDLAALIATAIAFVDTEVAAIKAKTDNLPSDPADASDIAASFTALAATLATISGFIDTEVAAIKSKTDNLPASPAATGDIPTAVENADALLGRNIAGGSDGGRDVTSALRASRNKVEIDPGTGALTVYAEDDTTPAWTGVVTRVSADAIQAVDPS